MNFTDFVAQFTFFTGSKKDFLAVVESQLAKASEDKKSSAKTLTVATPNPEQLVQAWENPQFAAALKKFDYLLPDGVGLVWLSQTKPQKLTAIKQKVAGVEVVEDLLALGLARHWQVLILGGKNYDQAQLLVGSKQIMVKTIQSSADLKVTESDKDLQLYWLAGFADATRPKPEENQLIAKCLKELQPDLVLVALGAPRQEFWIEENLSLLARARVKLAMAVGGSFDILFGQLPRAPQYFRQLNLEWLWRLLLQPTRIKRQLKLIKFIWLSLKG